MPKSIFYDCRFCHQSLEVVTEIPKYIYKKGVCISMVMVYACKKCGVVLVEDMLNYTPKQIKEMFGDKK